MHAGPFVCIAKMSNNKFNLFLASAGMIYEEFGIIPLLYGSLGLEYLTGDNLNSDDIDILIPRVFITERWQEFKGFLESQGYLLTDDREHTFFYDGTVYSYAELEEIEAFAGIFVENICVKRVNGVSFMLLTLEQYLAVYRKSSNDGYRVNVRNKKDGEKIRFIENKIKLSHFNS